VDPDPAFQVNPDTDPIPDPGFDDQKWRKNTAEINIYLFFIKNSVGDPDPKLDPDPQDPHVFGPPGSRSVKMD
jgi:hypothetical protein